MGVLVFVEDPEDELSQQALTFARGLGEEVHAVAIDDRDGYAPAAWGQALAAATRNHSPSTVVAPGTERGNEVLAHVAAELDLPMAANCTSRHPGRSGDGHARALGWEPARGGAAARLARAPNGRSPRRAPRTGQMLLPNSRRSNPPPRRWCVCPSAFRRRPPACR